MKKQGLLISMLIALTALTGCNSNDSGEDISFDSDGNLMVSKEGTKIKVWGYCDGDERTRMEQLVSAFNEKYKDYNISAKFVPYAASGWEQKMKTTLASRQGPDVFLASDEYYKQFVTLGFMENLDPYINSKYPELNMQSQLADMFEGGVGRYKYDPVTTTSNSENAHYYGIPKGTGSTAIYYNKTFLANANVKEISIYEKDIDAYNSANKTTYPKKAYFKYSDGKYYFNNKIEMSWQECAELANKLQSNPKNKAAGCKEGFLTSWWFNYGFSVGGDCIQYLDSSDSKYNGGYYTFTLADATVNYKVKEALTVNNNSYDVNEIISYEDKFFLTDDLANKCVVLPSQRRAFSEYMSLSGIKDSNHYYASEKGVTDIFWEIVPYKLAGGKEAGITKNNQIMRNEVTTFTPADNEKYGNAQVKIMNKEISPNPANFSTDGRAGYFSNKHVAMLVDVRACVQDFRDAMDEGSWDVAPMLMYKEFDENDNVTVEGIKGAHSGSNAWCVWSKSPIKNAGYLFTKFATTEEGQKILAEAGTIIPNQKSIASELVKKDVNEGKDPQNLEIFIDGAEYQTPGDWWYLKDGDWIDSEGCWANYLNQTVRNYRNTLEGFYSTNDYTGTFDRLLKYTEK